jgi:hypothetical protein
LQLLPQRIKQGLMKSFPYLVALFAPIAFHFPAAAGEWIAEGKAPAALARGLNHAILHCNALEAKNATGEEPGFFPLSISATRKADGNVTFAIETADPKAGFSYGGDDLTEFEMTSQWFIVSVGDDGRRHLFLNREFMADVAKRNAELACERDDATGKPVSNGEITGIITEIWDAGTMHSMPINCCAEYPVSSTGSR